MIKIEQDKPKRDWDKMFRDFFIPRNFIDVIFIVICIIVAAYAVMYEIPEAMREPLCFEYWYSYRCPCALDPFANMGNYTPLGYFNQSRR